MPGMPVHDGRNKQQMNNARIQGTADRVLRTGPYLYGIIVWMKKTLHIDEQLLRDAKSASGAKTDTDTVRLGLEALVRHGAYERLRALRGSEPHARDIRRRRERARSVKRSAA
jgi:Arc/MetJ family transcription regulator